MHESAPKRQIASKLQFLYELVQCLKDGVLVVI